jgi:hypothetical protein
MKAIQPVTLWVNGQQQTANHFELYIVNDNLTNSATFYFELINQVITPGENPDSDPQVSNIMLAKGNSTLEGTEYNEWGDSADINEDAYVRIAAKLNITLL